jgi:ABC transporter DrrB family efflux protein
MTTPSLSAPPATAVRLLVGRTLRHFLRNQALILGAIITPIVMMFMMMAVFGPVITRQTGLPFVDRIGPLTILLTITFGLGSTAVGYFDDVHSGVLRRLRTMPVAAMSLLAGRAIGDVIRMLCVGAITLAIAAVAGLRLPPTPVDLVGFIGVVVAYSCLFTTLALCVAVHATTTADAQNVLNVPAMLMLFLSSGYVPVAAFPGFIQPVVRANPLTYGVDAMVGLSGGGPVAGPVLGVVAWSVAGSGLFLLLAVRRLARANAPGSA